MPVTWGNFIIAEPTFQGVHGVEAAGAYALRFSINFMVSNWAAEGKAPAVTLTPAAITIEAGGRSLLLGYAMPETAVPFAVGMYGHSRGLIYELLAMQSGMDTIERLRDQGMMTFRLKIGVVFTLGDVSESAYETVLCRVPASDWLAVLAATAYQKTLVVEIPMPGGDEGQEVTGASTYLANAQTHLRQGHYDEAVASCRLALEAWTSQRKESVAMASAREQQRTAPKSLSLQQRELLIRQAVTNLAHLAHHAQDGTLPQRFDRDAAKMTIGLTASILARVQ